MSFFACSHVPDNSKAAAQATPPPTGRAPQVALTATKAPARESTPFFFPPQEFGESPLQKVARAHRVESTACWRDARAGHNTAQPSYAKIVLEIQLSVDGRVSNVRVTQRADAFPELADCLARNIIRWRFPTSSTELNLQLPFVFADRAAP